MDRSDRLPKHLLFSFAMALVIYAAFFAGDQWMRTRKGPWEVVFQTNGQGHAEIVISQRALGISNATVTFQREAVTNIGRVRFDVPKQPLPFGVTKFEDLTYLPGSVAMDFFGHEVELLPRTLYLNKKEYPWVSGMNYVLKPDEKLPPEMTYDPRKKKRRRRD